MIAILSPPDADAAERILAKINYQADVTVNETTPQSEVKGFAKMILNIFVLAGLVLALCIVGGVGFAGYRIMSRKMWRKEDTPAMIVLGIGDQPHRQQRVSPSRFRALRRKTVKRRKTFPTSFAQERYQSGFR